VALESAMVRAGRAAGGREEERWKRERSEGRGLRDSAGGTKTLGEAQVELIYGGLGARS
jgi:hypothetical protein